MTYLVPFLVALHVVPAVYWVGTTAVLARLGANGAALPLRTSQTISSLIAIVGGGALGWVLRSSSTTLRVGIACAVLAFLIQQAVWPQAIRVGRTAAFAGAQRASALLLTIALLAMLLFPYITA
jgi:hypothetical protein